MEEFPTEILIRGQKIPVRSKSSPEVVDEAVKIAALKIRDAELRAPRSAAHEVAVLALLDLAEEYVKAKSKASENRTKIVEKTERLTKLIEEEGGDLS